MRFIDSQTEQSQRTDGLELVSGMSKDDPVGPVPENAPERKQCYFFFPASYKTSTGNVLVSGRKEGHAGGSLCQLSFSRN